MFIDGACYLTQAQFVAILQVKIARENPVSLSSSHKQINHIQYCSINRQHGKLKKNVVAQTLIVNLLFIMLHRCCC